MPPGQILPMLSPVSFVHNLGIYVDTDLSVKTHVLRMAGRCFAVLHQMRSIQRSVTWPVLESLLVSLVLSQLVYRCATLAGLPNQLLNRLQSVQNAAARLIFFASRQVHIMQLLRSLHWLRMSEWIAFRLAVLVYRCLYGTAPSYLSVDLLRRWLTAATSLCDDLSTCWPSHATFHNL